jgi:hypothetical protein
MRESRLLVVKKAARQQEIVRMQKTDGSRKLTYWVGFAKTLIA